MTTSPRSPYSKQLGLAFAERTDGRAVVCLPITEAHTNTRGVAHGGVISSLIDTACGASVAYQPSVDGKGIATVALTVNFLNPAKPGDVLTAVGQRRGRGRRVVTCNCEVTNQAEEVVALGVATIRVL